MTTDKWTPANETQLAAMIKRKTDIMDKNKGPVIELAEKIVLWHMDSAVYSLPDSLIENAKMIRGVLEPFDDTFRVS